METALHSLKHAIAWLFLMKSSPASPCVFPMICLQAASRHDSVVSFNGVLVSCKWPGARKVAPLALKPWWRGFLWPLLHMHQPTVQAKPPHKPGQPSSSTPQYRPSLPPPPHCARPALHSPGSCSHVSCCLPAAAVWLCPQCGGDGEVGQQPGGGGQDCPAPAW